jgi:hypothetical protein
MLPDYLALKRDLAARLVRETSAAAHGAALLNEIAQSTLHEGDRWEILRADGSRSTTSFGNPIETKVVIGIEDARKHGPQASLRAVHDMSTELAEKMTKRMFETIGEAVEQVGNVIDAKGQPFSADLFIEMLEKIELSFDDAGNWQPPTITLHPETAEKVIPKLKESENDPAIKARMDAIIERKRGEWRAREARRTLVD